MSDEELNIISGKILDCSIEVHRNLGPGLLESIYHSCLCKEFDLRGIKYSSQTRVPIWYKGELIINDFKLDLLVEQVIVIELKAVETVHPVYSSQLLSYLRLMNKRLGLLINFNVSRLVDGYKRIINNIKIS